MAHDIGSEARSKTPLQLDPWQVWLHRASLELWYKPLNICHVYFEGSSRRPGHQSYSHGDMIAVGHDGPVYLHESQHDERIKDLDHESLQVIVNGMRVRIKLDEERIAELIKGTEPSAIPGLLRHLGNVASLSFTPYQNGERSHLSQDMGLCTGAMEDKSVPQDTNGLIFL